MSHKFLKLYDDDEGDCRDYDTNSKIILDDLKDYFCISVDLFYITHNFSSKVIEIKQKILKNGNYKCVFDTAKILIFINGSQDYEYKIYEIVLRSEEVAYDVLIENYCEINEIDYPCIIMSKPESLKLPGFDIINFEYLPCHLRIGPSDRKTNIYFAMRKGTMTKGAKLLG